MIFDLQSLLSNAQAITADAASTNVIDLGQPGTVPRHAAALKRDYGKGYEVPLRVQVVESFNNLTSLSIILQTSPVENFGSGVVEAARSPAYALAVLAVGARLLLPDEIPVGTDQRYMRLFYDVTGTEPTTGKITAGIVGGIQTN